MKITSVKRKISTFCREPQSALIKLLYFLSPVFPDHLYLHLLFPLKTGYKLNLRNPQTYNEKLQWLKMYYRDPALPTLVDKFEYKKHVEKLLGDQYVVKNYGVWESFDEIDFSKLPENFVLKTTHDQGGVVICDDISKFDFNAARTKLNKHLKNNLYYRMREWPYRFLKPRIIAEELLTDCTKGDLYDYKFYCFDGEPQIMYISRGRQGDRTFFDFYDMDFNHLDLTRKGYLQGDEVLEKPLNWELMKDIARRLSEGQPHVRIDFFNINGKILVGEYTLFQGGGMMPFYPRNWDYIFGEYLRLPGIKISKK